MSPLLAAAAVLIDAGTGASVLRRFLMETWPEGAASTDFRATHPFPKHRADFGNESQNFVGGLHSSPSGIPRRPIISVAGATGCNAISGARAVCFRFVPLRLPRGAI